MNAETGEITTSHKEAMDWYRTHINVKLIDWSDALNEWVERGEWVW